MASIERKRRSLESVASSGKVQRAEAKESSGGQSMLDLVNHTEGGSLFATGDGEHEALFRTVARRDVPFRKLVLAASRETN